MLNPRDKRDKPLSDKTYYGRFSPVKSTDADSNFSTDSHLLHGDYEMTDDDLDSKVSMVLPELMRVDGRGPSAAPEAAVFSIEPASQRRCVSVSSHDGRLSRSSVLVPPVVSLRPLYTSCTQQQQLQQQEAVSDEPPGDDQVPGEMLRRPLHGVLILTV